MEKVSLLKVDSYDTELKYHLIDLVDLIGGFDLFIKSGDYVLLKPNFVVPSSPEAAVNTHPDFIIAVCEILSDYGCRIFIGDSPMFGSVQQVVQKLGLYDRLKKYRVEIVEFKKSVPVDLSHDRLRVRKFKDLTLAGELQSFDKIINLPKLKSHVQMGVTLATKNLFGCVVGKRKTAWHLKAGSIRNFARLIVEVALTVNPALNIMDGIVGMDRNGPCHGRRRNTKVILASTNCIALDRVVVELIQKPAKKFAFFKAAEDLFIPGSKLEEIIVLGDSLEDCKIAGFQVIPVYPADFVGFYFLYGPLKQFFSQKIMINHKVCTRCRRCEENCPARAISFTGKIVIDRQKCIKCCCCIEGCPEGALNLHTPLLMRYLYGRR